MDEHGMKQQLIITGGLRTSRDVVKAIAMGADAVALASAPLMALGHQRELHRLLQCDISCQILSVDRVFLSLL